MRRRSEERVLVAPRRWDSVMVRTSCLTLVSERKDSERDSMVLVRSGGSERGES